MSKYNTILDGKLINDISESVGGYNYYGYLHLNGVWAILRENTAQTEYRYAVGNSNYAANWTDGAINATGIALNYKRSDQFNFKSA